MPLTAKQVSELSVFNNIAGKVPQGAYDLIAKSPLLVAELQLYSNEILANTRNPIGFLADTSQGQSGSQYNPSTLSIQIGNQFLGSAALFVASLAHEVGHEQNAQADLLAAQSATNAPALAQVCTSEEGIAIANNYLVSTQISQNGSATSVPILGMNQQMAAAFSDIQQAYSAQGVAPISPSATGYPTGGYLQTLSIAAATANTSNPTSMTGQTYLQYCETQASKTFPVPPPTSPAPATAPTENLTENADGTNTWVISYQINGTSVISKQTGAGEDITEVYSSSGNLLQSIVSMLDGTFVATFNNPAPDITTLVAVYNQSDQETTSTTYLTQGGAVIDQYDLANGLVGYEARYLPSGLTQVFYDTENTQAWSSITNVYLDGGATQKASETTVNDNGTSVKDTLNPSTGQVTSIDNYNAFNQETERDTYGPNGTIVDQYDTRTNTVNYEAQYLATGLTLTFYDTEGLYSWSSITKQFQDSAAQILESTRTLNDDQTSVIRDIDYTNSQAWSSQLVYESAVASVTSVVLNWDGGGSQDIVYAPGPGYTLGLYNFLGADGTGMLASETLDQTNGASQIWGFTGLAAGVQSSYWSYSGLDGSGALTGYGSYLTGGGETYMEYDWQNDQPWTSSGGTLNAAWGTVTATQTLDNGDSTEWWFDQANAQVSTQDYWGANGVTWQINYNTEGNQPWQWQKSIWTSGGDTEQITDASDGTWTDTKWDNLGQYNWASQEYVHGADNQTTEIVTNYDDGWDLIQTFDPYNRATWSQDDYWVDPQGGLANAPSTFMTYPYAEKIVNDSGYSVWKYYLPNGSIQYSIDDAYNEIATIKYNTINNEVNYSPLAYWYLSTPDWTGGSLGIAGGDAGIDHVNFTIPVLTFSFQDAALSASYVLGTAWSVISDFLDSFFSIFDPIVLNLQGGSITTTSAATNGITFDLQGNGGKQAVGWISQGEGFLVVDKDHTGQIGAKDFIADINELASYDSNGDGQITAADAQFPSLEVWIPGVAGSAGTLQTLQHLGIADITLEAAAVNQADNGNWISQSITFTKTDGSTGQAADVFFSKGASAQRAFAYNSGDGILQITNDQLASTQNTGIVFGAGIDASDVTAVGDVEGDLVLTVASGGKIVLSQALASTASAYPLQTITFADGSTWTYAQLIAQATTGSSTGQPLYGDAGANLFDSKGLASFEQGNGGGDTFLFNSGYGRLQISEADFAAASGNTLRFGGGIAPVDVSVSVGGPSMHDILMRTGAGADQIDLAGMLDGPQFGIQEVDFADGTTWSRSALVAMASMTAPGTDAGTAALLQSMASFAPLGSLTPPPAPQSPTAPDLNLTVSH